MSYRTELSVQATNRTPMAKRPAMELDGRSHCRSPPTAPLMHTDVELEEKILKVGAAVGTLEVMDRELGVIGKVGVLRSCKAQIAEIRRAIRGLISTLERSANLAQGELKRRQLNEREMNAHTASPSRS